MSTETKDDDGLNHELLEAFWNRLISKDKVSPPALSQPSAKHRAPVVKQDPRLYLKT